jgi:hypothetical protein
MPTKTDSVPASAIADLRRIPGVGPSIANDLYRLGITQVSDLRGGNAEALYKRLCEQRGTHIDRCALYVFRCAVYYASETAPDPQLLKWWNWKDANVQRGRKPSSSAQHTARG